MMRIYDSRERKFQGNGLQIIEPYVKDPIIHEIINGSYELTFRIAIFHSKNIEKENIVMSRVPNGTEQPFRIAQYRKELGYYNVVAFHIFYDNVDNFIEDTNIVDKDANTALQQIKSKCTQTNIFTFDTNITSIKANCRLVRVNPVQALIGNAENTFANRWGGEILRDKFKISMKERLGKDTSIQIRHKKNLLGYEADVDFTQVTTKIMPKGADGILLPEKYVISHKINDYANQKIKVIEYPSVKLKTEESSSNDEGYKTLEECYAELRRLANLEFIEKNIDFPIANYKINFIDLSKTKEYKNYKILEKLYLGDSVRVIHKKENLDLKARIIAYKYDPIRDMYIELEIGNSTKNFVTVASEISRVESKVNDINRAVSAVVINNQVDLTNVVKYDEKKILLEQGFPLMDPQTKHIDASGDEIAVKVNAYTGVSINRNGLINLFCKDLTSETDVIKNYAFINPFLQYEYQNSEGISSKSKGLVSLKNMALDIEHINCLNVKSDFIKTKSISTEQPVTTSDRNLKENIRYIDSELIEKENNKINISELNKDDILGFINNTDFATYNYIDSNQGFSLIIQDIKNENVKKYLVVNSENKLSINTYVYESMIHFALKEEIKKNQKLEKRVKKLEDKTYKRHFKNGLKSILRGLFFYTFKRRKGGS